MYNEKKSFIKALSFFCFIIEFMTNPRIPNTPNTPDNTRPTNETGGRGAEVAGASLLAAAVPIMEEVRGRVGGIPSSAPAEPITEEEIVELRKLAKIFEEYIKDLVIPPQNLPLVILSAFRGLSNSANGWWENLYSHPSLIPN